MTGHPQTCMKASAADALTVGWRDCVSADHGRFGMRFVSRCCAAERYARTASKAATLRVSLLDSTAMRWIGWSR